MLFWRFQPPTQFRREQQMRVKKKRKISKIATGRLPPPTVWTAHAENSFWITLTPSVFTLHHAEISSFKTSAVFPTPRRGFNSVTCDALCIWTERGMLGRFPSVLFVFYHYSLRRALVLMIPLLELKLVFLTWGPASAGSVKAPLYTPRLKARIQWVSAKKFYPPQDRNKKKNTGW